MRIVSGGNLFACGNLTDIKLFPGRRWLKLTSCINRAVEILGRPRQQRFNSNTLAARKHRQRTALTPPLARSPGCNRIVRCSQVHPEVMLTDTVGFIQKLPTNLVAAFRATLEEVRCNPIGCGC